MGRVFWQGGALLAPVPPALVTAGDIENPLVLTIGWAGILNTKPPKTYISVRPSRHTYNTIKETGEFVINLPTKHIVSAVDFCGCRSGADVDKFSVCKLDAIPSKNVIVPAIKQCPVALECKVFDIVKLGSHDMFMADIVGVSIDDNFIDDKGKLCLDKAGLIAYAHGEYFELGNKLGSFGYSVRKKK